MRTLMLTIILAFTLLPGAALADPIQYPDGSWRWSAISRWTPEITIQVGNLCDIQLEEGERIRQALLSDSTRWRLNDGKSGDATPHLFIKPTQENIRTMLMVTTTRRVYHVLLISTPSAGHTYVGFYYPQAFHPAPRPAPTAPTATCGAPLDAAYRFKGSKEFLPRSVCNDGRHTFINMGTIEGSLPVLVAIGDDGHDQIGNFSYNNTISQYIIDGVPQRLALLRDGGKGQFRVNIQREKHTR